MRPDSKIICNFVLDLGYKLKLKEKIINIWQQN